MNFGAGPAALYPEVKEALAKAIIQLPDAPYSLAELPHRSATFVAIVNKCNDLVRSLLHVPDTHETIWIQGGGRTQFAMIPLNFLPNNKQAAYLDSGFWAHDAYAHALKYGNAKIIGSSQRENYKYLPSIEEHNADSAYLHYTSNNTIYGTQWKSIPETKAPLIVDMSSDIFSRPIDVAQYKMIYAVAQKNIGISGVTMVIIDKEFAATALKNIPAIWRYENYIQQNSLINTAPVVSIYSCFLTLLQYQKIGIEHIFENNLEKATLLYDYINSEPLLHCTPEKDFSDMNVCCSWGNKAMDEKYIAYAQQHGILGIEGHRSVGGLRISLYNAITKDNVLMLIDNMKAFANAVR